MKRTVAFLFGLLLLLLYTNAYTEASLSDTQQPLIAANIAKATGITLPIKKVLADEYTSFFLDSNNKLYACGTTISLGVGMNQASIPELVMEDVSSVSSSEGHTLIIKTDGSLWACGDNTYGQLGNGTTENSETFLRIMEDVDQAIAKFSSSFAIKKDGTLWMWGEKEYFLDKKEWDRWPDNGNMLTPEYVTDNVKDIALGLLFALVLKDDGILYIQGNYPYHLLIEGKHESWFYKLQPIIENVRTIAAVNDYWLALKSDGELWHHGKYTPSGLQKGIPEVLMNGVQSIAVTDGRNYGSAYALKDNGTLLAWGNNSSGQIGDGTGNEYDTPFQVLDNVNQLAVGGYHSIAMKQDGGIWAWGYNNMGQLGNGYTEHTLQPCHIMENVVAFDNHDSRLVQKTDGSIWTWGLLKNDAPPRMVVNNAREYFSLGYVEGNYANGYTEVNQYVLKDDFSLWAWGKNDNGQLGDGTTSDRAEPVHILSGVKAVFVDDSSYDLPPKTVHLES